MYTPELIYLLETKNCPHVQCRNNRFRSFVTSNKNFQLPYMRGVWLWFGFILFCFVLSLFLPSVSIICCTSSKFYATKMTRLYDVPKTLWNKKVFLNFLWKVSNKVHMHTTHIRVLQCQPVEVCFFRFALFFEFVSCGQCRLISFVFANAQKKCCSNNICRRKMGDKRNRKLRLFPLWRNGPISWHNLLLKINKYWTK